MVASPSSCHSIWDSPILSDRRGEPKDDVGSITTADAGTSESVSSGSLWSRETSPAQSSVGSPLRRPDDAIIQLGDCDDSSLDYMITPEVFEHPAVLAPFSPNIFTPTGRRLSGFPLMTESVVPSIVSVEHLSSSPSSDDDDDHQRMRSQRSFQDKERYGRSSSVGGHLLPSDSEVSIRVNSNGLWDYLRHQRDQIDIWLWSVFAVGTPAFYILVAFLDVQGGTLTVVAFNYANLASCCLIDWISLLTAFVLSIKFMGEKATRSHIVALLVGLVGSLCILVSDSMTETTTPLSSPTSISSPIITPSLRLTQMTADMLIAPAISHDSQIALPNGVMLAPTSSPNIDIYLMAERPAVPVVRTISKADRLFGDVMCLLAATFLGIVTVMMEKALVSGVRSAELLCTFIEEVS